MFKKVITNRIVQAASIIIAITSICTGIWAVDDRYAKDTEVVLLAARLEQKIVADRIAQLQDRIWALEDRYGGKGVPSADAAIRAEYRHLLKQIEVEKRKLNK